MPGRFCLDMSGPGGDELFAWTGNRGLFFSVLLVVLPGPSLLMLAEAQAQALTRRSFERRGMQSPADTVWS